MALADFGSTYTKLRLVGIPEGWLLATAQAPTSLSSDLMDGYRSALAIARAAVDGGVEIEIEAELAASSAGGGLRVGAIGLVADLTAAAAHQAALNAGARVGAVLAGELDGPQLRRLDRANPEIVLFAGGTDGGQRDLVIANARRLAEHGMAGRAVVACNAAIAPTVAGILTDAGIPAEVADNVMPGLGKTRIESARKAISAIFLEHVIGGKGLSAGEEFTRMVRMPTPEAVLNATTLLARGIDGEGGIGEVVVVDIGGATTDVHSERGPEAAAPGIEGPLLQEPSTRRTVEGDLGLRSGAPGVAGIDGAWLRAELGETAETAARDFDAAIETRAGSPEWIPDDDPGRRLDGLLATSCATQALDRHCGTLILRRSMANPPSLVRSGPDLREVGLVIGTGGVLVHREDGEDLIRAALGRGGPRLLSPRRPTVRCDRDYILAAAGLLATIDPASALRLLRTEVGE